MTHPFDQFDSAANHLAREWLITIQTPQAGVKTLVDALSRDIPLKQGAYDCCLFIRGGGKSRYRSREGAHGGAEDVIRSTDSAEVMFTIPPNADLLKEVFSVIFASHVHEEPTIHVREVWGSRSKYADDKDNPNRYWNQAAAKDIHGEAEDT